jgi:hypothetical protein
MACSEFFCHLDNLFLQINDSVHRIQGDSDFVSDVLSESEKEFSRKYKFKSLGYDYEKIVERF